VILAFPELSADSNALGRKAETITPCAVKRMNLRRNKSFISYEFYDCKWSIFFAFEAHHYFVSRKSGGL
jgi:hypothetical protein